MQNTATERGLGPQIIPLAPTRGTKRWWPDKGAHPPAEKIKGRGLPSDRLSVADFYVQAQNIGVATHATR
ncbi:hypothetical protein AWC11_16525 [Mycobacterium interjectum]|nr:hypothetical protein AWC11_16525 [Mycobacterium interjectum]